MELEIAAVLLQSNIRGFARRQKFLYMRRHRAAALIQVNELVIVAILRGFPSVISESSKTKYGQWKYIHVGDRFSWIYSFE